MDYHVKFGSRRFEFLVRNKSFHSHLDQFIQFSLLALYCFNHAFFDIFFRYYFGDIVVFHYFQRPMKEFWINRVFKEFDFELFFQLDLV
ncbi:MAG: hypothetical protein NTY66_02400 [Candidatus Vogelbacteria bacterium]|nr:hypothetical protein [Candidatus Vogelbacteria bacterium]